MIIMKPQISKELAGRVLAEILAGVSDSTHSDIGGALGLGLRPPTGTALAELSALTSTTGTTGQPPPPPPPPVTRKPGDEMRGVIEDVIRGMISRCEITGGKK